LLIRWRLKDSNETSHEFSRQRPREPTDTRASCLQSPALEHTPAERDDGVLEPPPLPTPLPTPPLPKQQRASIKKVTAEKEMLADALAASSAAAGALRAQVDALRSSESDRAGALEASIYIYIYIYI
jgi:hypothetical protein